MLRMVIKQRNQNQSCSKKKKKKELNNFQLELISTDTDDTQ